jgi:hypothetical protein
MRRNHWVRPGVGLAPGGVPPAPCKPTHPARDPGPISVPGSSLAPAATRAGLVEAGAASRRGLHSDLVLDLYDTGTGETGFCDDSDF